MCLFMVLWYNVFGVVLFWLIIAFLFPMPFFIEVSSSRNFTATSEANVWVGFVLARDRGQNKLLAFLYMWSL